jgi:hypothetical protein
MNRKIIGASKSKFRNLKLLEWDAEEQKLKWEIREATTRRAELKKKRQEATI